MRGFKITAVIGALALPLALAACGSSSPTTSTTGGPPAGAVTGPGVPAFDPASFVRTIDNPWFPLKPGTTLRYRGEKDAKPGVDVMTVTSRTKTILGVPATVVSDRLFLRSGKLAETTLDWYGQDGQGNVWYLGEATRALDKNGRLTDTSGSWQAGVDGAKGGIFMPADPKVGQGFQQEFYKGQAEDHFRILSLNSSVSVPAVSSQQAMRTEETTALEPGVVDNKYYVRGIGTVRELTIKGGNEHFALTSVKRG